ncbi:exodeoxyribonuclease VII large subunit, partial [Cysteiniphilum sp. JM-1]|uniref:exodeoxyribonuclease VII large subunit n=1 Tax=Cysteiniphilum sp. JM-1 TaxID=2610891 RepID=UPI001245889A
MSLTALTTIKEPLSLSDFLTQVKQSIDERFNGNHGYWVRGEISQWQKNAGHFYGELVEFDDNTQQLGIHHAISNGLSTYIAMLSAALSSYDEVKKHLAKVNIHL